MMMNKYFAVYKQGGDARGRSVTISAPNVGAALDEMMKQVGKTRSDDDDEYDLYEVVDGLKYVPVAAKFKKVKREQPVIEAEVVEQHTFTEKLYVSWRDAA